MTEPVVGEGPHVLSGGAPLGEDLNKESAAVRRRYDRGSRFYDWEVWPMEVLMMERFRRQLMARIVGPRVLEVGVGTGRNLTLYDAKLQVTAIDFSAGMLARARRGPVPENVHLYQMDAQRLAFPDGAFDCAVSTCVFCSVPDAVRGLKEVRRVLRPGGTALFLEHVRPTGRWLGPLFDRLDPLVSRAGPHINRQTVDNIRAAGLVIEEEQNLISDILKLVVARA